MSLFKNEFNDLFKALNNAGYTPTMGDLQRIILSREPKIIPSRVPGREPIRVSSEGKVLKDYLVQTEARKRQVAASEKGGIQVAYPAILNEVRATLNVPTVIIDAYNKLPESPEALGTINQFVIASGELVQASELNSTKLI